MIPYDDLVAALASWRARQGLPVTLMSGASAPVAAPAPAPISAPIAAPRTAPPGGRAGGFLGSVATPPPLAAVEPVGEESLDVDDASLIEEAQYDGEGNDFAMAFGNQHGDGESTAIGVAPARVAEGESETMNEALPARRGRPEEW
ncbi:MAG: hypothetical protein ACTHU0_21015 [Kofleriaceae bacterium]